VPARVARLVVALLAGLLLVAVTGPIPLPHVRSAAAETPADVTVQIATITPLSPGPKDTLRITGRLVSRGGPDLTGVQISLHLGRAVASRSELHGLRASPVAQPLIPNQQDLGNGRLDPGQSLAFTINKPISSLQLPGAGVYPMQVTAIGIEDGRYRDLATASTFLPYIPAAQATPVSPVAWLVPLTADPVLLADGTFADSQLVASVAPGGRLRRLLDGLRAATAATATVDPAVIRALTVAANGRYRVARAGTLPTGAPQAKPASADARSWLSDLRAASSVSMIGLPYADVDVEAILHAGTPSLADDARRRSDDVLSVGLLNAKSRLVKTIAVPPGGSVDAAGVAYYHSAAKATGLVLAGSAVPTAGDNPSGSASAPGVPTRLLLADDVLTQLVTSESGTTPRLAAQEVLAELAEAHLEDRFSATPAGGSTVTAARPLLIAPPAGWNPPASWLTSLLTDTAGVPWLAQVPVSSLLDAPAEPRAQLRYPATARAAQLPSGAVDSSARLTAATQGLFSRTQPGDPRQSSPQRFVQPIRDAALSAVSSRWRRDPFRSQVFRDSAAATFAGLQQQVRVVASPQVTLTSRSGRVPVTLENDLGAAVDVSLMLTSLDRSRVSSGTLVRRTVRAGQKVQVEVEVKAASAGTFPVRLALFTADGQPLGRPAQVLVRSTTYGVVATVFTEVALSVLGLAVLLRAVRAWVRRSRRSGRSPRTPADPAGVS
jgi:hypothetical protein